MGHALGWKTPRSVGLKPPAFPPARDRPSPGQVMSLAEKVSCQKAALCIGRRPTELPRKARFGAREICPRQARRLNRQKRYGCSRRTAPREPGFRARRRCRLPRADGW
jgi:hypothetical protein